MRHEDVLVARVQQTLVNLQIDTEKHKPAEIKDFTMYDNKGATEKVLNSNTEPDWKRQKSNMLAWTTGAKIRRERGG